MGLRENIKPFPTCDKLYNLTYEEFTSFPSLQESVMNSITTKLVKGLGEVIIDIVRGLNLCKEGEEVEFMNNNHCFQENHSYWLKCNEGLFHLLKIYPPDFKLEENPISINGNIQFEIIGKKIR